MSDLVTYAWQWWVNTVGSLGLPIGRQASAYFALILVFYGIGAGL